jgi:dTDP-4-amino-4,6-dideoxygalactose transaminase
VRIPFTRPSFGMAEVRAATRALRECRTVGNGPICERVEKRLAELTGSPHLLLTPNATQAMEVALFLFEIGPGDEVIMPSFAFVSMANAIVSRGARPVFAEIDPRTLNMDPADVARRVTDKTRMVMPVHYAGISCDMDGLLALCKERELVLFEDAAQAFGSTWRGRQLGTLGEAGCFSFHETKNITSGGEGGALLVREEAHFRRAEIVHEKGTNRSAFLRGEVDKYTWVDRGGSYVLSDLLAAVLEVQLERAAEIQQRRLDVWNRYQKGFEELERKGVARRPFVPEHAEHNAHIYYLLAETPELQQRVMRHLKDHGISATFHFQPLHASPYAREHLGTAGQELPVTTEAAECIIRLPLHVQLNQKKTKGIVEATLAAFAAA